MCSNSHQLGGRSPSREILPDSAPSRTSVAGDVSLLSISSETNFLGLGGAMLRLGPNLDAVNTYYTASHSHRQRVCNNSLEARNKINLCHSMLYEPSHFQRAQWYAKAAL